MNSVAEARNTARVSSWEGIADDALVEAISKQPLLEGFVAAQAGYVAVGTGRLALAGVRNASARTNRAASLAAEDALLAVYCISGSGCCRLVGKTLALRKGDLAIVRETGSHRCRAEATSPWTVYWARAIGRQASQHLQWLGTGEDFRALHIGDNLELARLFNEVRLALRRCGEPESLLHAANALRYLLSFAFLLARQSGAASDTIAKIAQSIIYMSEHLHAPPRMSALAKLSGLSQAHFSVLFKDQTGCSPRDYLRLLRVHQACELLRKTGMSIKEIAARLGYQDQFHFSRQFKLSKGISPTLYRQGGS